MRDAALYVVAGALASAPLWSFVQFAWSRVFPSARDQVELLREELARLSGRVQSQDAEIARLSGKIEVLQREKLDVEETGRRQRLELELAARLQSARIEDLERDLAAATARAVEAEAALAELRAEPIEIRVT